MVFPLGKLLYLALKQVARPISKQLQSTAKNSQLMKNKILIPIGQLIHRMDMFVRMRVMGLAGPVEVRPLKDNVAIETGADMFGEIFVFSIGAGILAAEYYRSSKKEATREEAQMNQLSELKVRMDQLGGTLHHMEEQLTELKTKVNTVKDKTLKE